MKEYSIYIQKTGITRFDTDAIVNAANEGLWEGGGVCGAVFRDAGAGKLKTACDAIGHCDTGSAVITPGFDLPAKYIIHAVGPVWHGGDSGEGSLLYDAYKNSLLLAKENNLHSITFPLISSGIFGYPLDGAWRKAIRACVNFLDQNPDYSMEIYFAVLDDKVLAKGKETLQSITSENGSSTIAGDDEYKPNTKTVLTVPAKSTPADRVAVFEDTLAWINSDSKLSASVALAKKSTKVYYEDDYPDFDTSESKDAIVSVTKDRSYQAAMRLHKENPDCRIAVMNFANAYHAGGGVAKGSSAQEECLCRTSTLYPLIYRKTLKGQFYDYHKNLSQKNNNAKASDSLIYTKGVIICKSDEEFPKRLPEAEWVNVDVITIAAPDLRTKSNQHVALVGNGTFMNNAELFGYHVKRAIHMLTVAAHEGANILVLGAFGCGAFQNNPQVVARAYKVALDEFPGVFDRIEFAIYCKPQDETNYEMFKRILEK